MPPSDQTFGSHDPLIGQHMLKIIGKLKLKSLVNPSNLNRDDFDNYKQYLDTFLLSVVKTTPIHLVHENHVLIIDILIICKQTFIKYTKDQGGQLTREIIALTRNLV